MRSRQIQLVQSAVMRAGARPMAFWGALGAAWMVSQFAGVAATALAATTGYLGVVLGILMIAPEVGDEALLEANPVPLLSSGEDGGGGRRKALPPGLRERFQELHREVRAMLDHWPTGLEIPLERAHLEAVPEAFRELAHLRAGMAPEDPGVEKAESRLQAFEDRVRRLKKTWGLLVTHEADPSELLEGLERTGDEIEALLEVESG